MSSAQLKSTKLNWVQLLVHVAVKYNTFHETSYLLFTTFHCHALFSFKIPKLKLNNFSFLFQIDGMDLHLTPSEYPLLLNSTRAVINGFNRIKTIQLVYLPLISTSSISISKNERDKIEFIKNEWFSMKWK